MNKLNELKDRLMDEIMDYAGAGKLSKEDAMNLKALTGAADHLSNLIDKADGGYSGRYMPYAYDDGRSYARRRDSMGRYSRDGYSRHTLADKMRELMDEAPDERTRQEINRLVDKMENA